jgi:chromosomal replication initiation ATPase DnaA
MSTIADLEERLQRLERLLLHRHPPAQSPDVHAFHVILAVVSRHLHVSSRLILSPIRRETVAYARFFVYALARKYTTLSYAAIGRLVGGRDHSSALHGAARLREILSINARARTHLAAMENNVQIRLSQP